MREIELFDLRGCLEACNLIDSKPTCNFFTWTNKQDGDSGVFCKLDRVIWNERWFKE